MAFKRSKKIFDQRIKKGKSMNKHRPYNNLIERKLEQLPGADADHLWNDMHSILDKKMPQKKERRRFIFWLFNDKGLLVISLAFLFIGGASVFLLSTKENKVVLLQKTSLAQPLDKTTQLPVAKTSTEPAIDNTTNNNTISDKTNSFVTTSLTADDKLAANNLFVKKQSSNSKEYNQPITQIDGQNENRQSFLNYKPDLEINPLYFTSNHNNPVLATENNKLIDSLLRKDEFTKPNISRNDQKGFYAGFMSGIDLSSIHFKSVRTGSSKGFVLGYAFNKKWSIESGLSWDTKRVYDNGRFFNPPGYTTLSGITITAVNGKSKIYEVPVNIKYNITTGEHNLFTTAGLSSYFMRSENYDYEYTQNNQPGGHNYISYKNASKNLFSVANVSIGYTHKIGSNGSIRVESYVKLPLSNIGVAKMPITSTGLNVGFIKKIR